MNAKEKFYHLVWRHGLFDSSRLVTTEGEPVAILDRGRENTGAGPDFVNARLKIGSVILVGNVEIHVQGVEWFEHRHHEDPAYGNVILHVVAEKPLPTHCLGLPIPVAELGMLISPAANHTCQSLMLAKNDVPCASLLSQRSWAPERIVLQWHSSAAARLQDKAARLTDLARHAKLTDEDVAWAALLRSLGFGVNSEPFQMLALRLPWQLMARHRDKPCTTAALVYGMAGLIGKIADSELQATLAKEFAFFAPDLKAEPLTSALWHFGGTRPGNHPPRRLNLFLNLYNNVSYGLGDLFLSTTRVNSLKKIFSPSAPLPKELKGLSCGPLSESALHLIIVNCIAPYLAYLSDKYRDESLFERAVAWLEQLPPEQNRFSRLWQRIGYAPANAFESQGILELSTKLCRMKGCLQCSIGQALIKMSE
jgi:hypothetical protein